MYAGSNNNQDISSGHTLKSTRPANRHLRNRIVVLSDGTALSSADPASQHACVESALHEWMALIPEQTGLKAHAVNMLGGAAYLRSQLRALPSDVAGVVVIDTHPDHLAPIYAWAQDRECAVFTGPVMTAVAAAAALLTSLTRQGKTPGCSRVVITGAASMPMLSRLLITSGVAEVTRWDHSDDTSFPLRSIASDADAVIDLLHCPRELADTMSAHPELIVITPNSPDWAVLALPSLLDSVITASPPTVTLETCYAGALALVAATPGDRLLPHPVQMTPPVGRQDRAKVSVVRGGIPWRQRSLRNVTCRPLRAIGIRPAASATSDASSLRN